MDSMFENNRVFDQNIKKWDVTDAQGNFISHTNFNNNCPLQDKHNPFIKEPEGIVPNPITKIEAKDIWARSQVFSGIHPYNSYAQANLDSTEGFYHSAPFNILDKYFTAGDTTLNQYSDIKDTNKILRLAEKLVCVNQPIEAAIIAPQELKDNGKLTFHNDVLYAYHNTTLTEINAKTDTIEFQSTGNASSSNYNIKLTIGGKSVCNISASNTFTNLPNNSLENASVTFVVLMMTEKGETYGYYASKYVSSKPLNAINLPSTVDKWLTKQIPFKYGAMYGDFGRGVITKELIGVSNLNADMNFKYLQTYNNGNPEPIYINNKSGYVFLNELRWDVERHNISVKSPSSICQSTYGTPDYDFVYPLKIFFTGGLEGTDNLKVLTLCFINAKNPPKP